MAAASRVIETNSLTKHYGDIVAVDGLSMSVPCGHVFGLLGPNGSGKTTTMSMLLGLVRPTSGGFSLFGSSDGLEQALHRVGAIIESPSFYPYLTGRQNLLYFQGISGRGTSDEIDSLLERVGLADRGDHRFRTYSLGMKQRLGLAYSLLGEPELLFLESPSFYPYLTGRQNLLYFQGISGRGTSDEIDSLLERVGLADRGDHRFRTYSLGMKQRLGLAYSLLGEPELLFLDEPTNGMDPAGMADVRDLIRSLGTGGRTVLLSSHLLHEVEQVCDSVAILSKGKLIAQGDVADLLRSQDQIRLKTTDNAKAVGVLSTLDWIEDVKIEEGEVVVAASGDRAPELSTTLGRSEVYVTDISTGQKSLESYFLEVTGDEGGE